MAHAPEPVATLLAAGEDVVACEVLCENLYEDDFGVARGLLSSLRVAARRAGADVALIETQLTRNAGGGCFTNVRPGLEERQLRARVCSSVTPLTARLVRIEPEMTTER